MGYIKEPDGVDFIIKGKPLTEKQKTEISAFIKEDKERLAKLASRKSKARTANMVHAVPKAFGMAGQPVPIIRD